MPHYIATVNTPGYLPGADYSPAFETAHEAWQYLAEERERQEEEEGTEVPRSDDGGCIPGGYSETVATLERYVRWAKSGLVTDSECCDTVYGPTPGYTGDHDLGLAYSVSECEGCDLFDHGQD